MTFEQAVAAISALEKRGWRLGLDRMRAFVEAAGLDGAIGPERRFLHVAGTNGKGSTTAYLQSLLVEQGWRAGAFFSPYVVDVRERVQLDRELIAPGLFAELTERLMAPAADLARTEFEGPTEFEFKTALGFAAWESATCEWVALEVGLGGRLDATNVVRPAGTAIVSIGLDHTEILGDTLDKIATEKAGIIKPGVPLVVGGMAPEALEAILAVARQHGVDAWVFGGEIQLRQGAAGWSVELPDGAYDGLTPGLHGVMQPHNMALAVAIAHRAGAIRDPAQVASGVARAYLPGRYQETTWRGAPVVLDGAHNVDSAKVLAATLRAGRGDGRNVVLVSGMLQGHHPEPFFEALAPLVKSAHLAPIAFHRTRDAGDLAGAIRNAIPAAMAHASVLEALEAALQETAPGDVIVVTGSFYLVGEVSRLIQTTSVA